MQELRVFTNDNREEPADKPLEIPRLAIALVEQSFRNRQYEIIDFDLDRIAIDSDDQEYVFRTWDITEWGIDWTLFRMVDDGNDRSHSEPVSRGYFSF